MRTRVPLFLLAAVSLASAQAPPPADQNKASVEGVVLNAVTGEPLRRAQVVLRTAASRGAAMMGGVPGVPRTPGVAASTDASGKFALTGIDPGRYVLSAERNGFLRADYGARRRGQSGTVLDLQTGSVKRDITIKLMPQGIVSGRVFDDEGEPLQSVFVQLLQKRYFSGSQRYVPAASATTNDRGEYRLLDVPPGRYVVVARTRGPLTMEGGIESQSGLGYAPTYYPGVTGAAQAGTVETAAGHESGGIEIRLQRARLFRISGQVIDGAGAPVKQANVQAIARDNPFLGGTSYSFSREPEGRFDIPGVPPGSYTIVARFMSGRENQPSVSVQQVELGERNLDGVVLTLTPGVALAGKVLVEGGGGPKLDTVRLTLAPALMMLPGATGAAKGDGTFTLDNVQPGKYRLSVIQPGSSTYLKAAKLGGQEVDPQEFDITGAQEMVVTLSTAGAKVSGTVATTAGPVSQATVVLMPAEESKRREGTARVTTTGEDGSFTLNGLAPGDYKVFAWEDIESGAWQDPDFLKPLESKGRAVKLEPSAGVTLTLEPIPAGQ